MTTLEQMGAKAKDASRFLMTAGSKKDIALGAIADALCENCEEILAANKIDLENGEKAVLRHHFSTDSDCRRRESTVWLTG